MRLPPGFHINRPDASTDLPSRLAGESGSVVLYVGGGRRGSERGYVLHGPGAGFDWDDVLIRCLHWCACSGR